jgi:hypothetical protein
MFTVEDTRSFNVCQELFYIHCSVILKTQFNFTCKDFDIINHVRIINRYIYEKCSKSN